MLKSCIYKEKTNMKYTKLRVFARVPSPYKTIFKELKNKLRNIKITYTFFLSFFFIREALLILTHYLK